MVGVSFDNVINNKKRGNKMTLRCFGFILGIILFLPHASAMEAASPEESNTLLPVKVRIWERRTLPNLRVLGAHISLETNKHYMSLYPNIQPSLRKKYVASLNELPNSFVATNFEIDQKIQNGKLQDKFNSTTHEEHRLCKTYVLYLNTQPMNAMWEKIRQGAEIALYDGEPTRYILKNVKYFKGDLFQRTILSPSDQDTTLYFSNTTLIKGLLYQGGIHKRLYAIENPKYFKNFLCSSSTTIMSDYEDVILNNTRIMWNRVRIEDIMGRIEDCLRRHKLLTIHKVIEARQMTYLNIQHEEAILNLLYDGNKTLDKNLESIDNYLLEQKSRYEEQQSLFSPAGWANTLYYKEWR